MIKFDYFKKKLGFDSCDDTVHGLSNEQWISGFNIHKDLAQDWIVFRSSLFDRLESTKNESGKDRLEFGNLSEEEQGLKIKKYRENIWELYNIMEAINDCKLTQEIAPIYAKLLDKIEKHFSR